jgi:hypothetical protein
MILENFPFRLNVFDVSINYTNNNILDCQPYVVYIFTMKKDF